LTTTDPTAQLRVAAGTSINLAGSDATVPMSANLVSVQLNSNELEDDPDQRNGALLGKTVIVDVRNGQPAIISAASWQSTLQGIQENVAQRTSAGGTASFHSEGDVVFSSGAGVNVSGGQWNYTGGVAQTSELIGTNGQTYNISTADPTLAYQGVLNPTYTQTYNGFGVQITNPTPGFSQYDPGYTAGFSAGSVSFAAPALSLQGTLAGNAVNGPYQRSAASIPTGSLIGYLAANAPVPGTGMALGGTLTIGTPVDLAGNFPEYFAPGISVSNNPAPVIVADGAPLPAQTLQLPASYLNSSGFSQTQIYSDSTVTLPTGLPLNLPAGGSLQIVAPRINIDSGITALDGTITFHSAESALSQAGVPPRPGIDIGAGVTLNVSGQWTNDLSNVSTGLAPTYQDGGKISLSLTDASSPNTVGGELVIGNGVSLEANGGAWLQSNGTLTGGQGGKITLDASPYQSALQVGNNVALAAFGVEGALGGSFVLNAPVIEVGPGNAWAVAQRADDLIDFGQPFKLGAGLFSQDGFSSVSLTATEPVPVSGSNVDLLTVLAGTSIDAQAQSLQLTPGFEARHSGGTIQGYAQATLLPEQDRTPYTVNLSVAPALLPDGSTASLVPAYGDLDIQAGTSIVFDPNASSSIALKSGGSILIGGLLQVPGGTIAATITTPTDELFDYGALGNPGIVLGATADLDVGGATIPTINSLNLPLGNVLPGGTVTLTAEPGFITAEPGSVINIAGASAPLDVLTTGGASGYTLALVGSSAGTLDLTSLESASLFGTLSAAAGASSAGTLEGGTLELTLGAAVPGGGSAPQQAPEYIAFSTTPATIEIVSSTAGSTPSAPYGNQAVLGVAQLEQAGIDDLQLSVSAAGPSAAIAIDTGTPLTLAREISLDAPNISVAYGTVASLTAPYVQLTDSPLANITTAAKAPVALGGTGSLTVNADQIVLSGFIALQGVGSTILKSMGDVEFEPQPNGSSNSGQLSVNGSLEIDAERVYPATYASYTINDSNTAGTVTIGQNGTYTGTPLSAGGALTISAANITNNGSIVAPFGRITLNATDTLSLGPTSLTSVSADGAVIPYGFTELNQQEWVAGSINTNQSGLSGSPQGQVTLNGQSVTLAQGAKVNLSGGGDLSAYEWVPGTGGSADVLNTTPGLFAILPGVVGGSYAPYDPQRYAPYSSVSFTGSASVPTVGESVYLSGVPGLAPGVYTLLPPSYALGMPGAYLVQAESGYSSLKPGTLGSLADGTPIVAGALTFGNTGLQSSSGYTGFAVRPGSYSGTLATYDVSYASTFFPAAAAVANSVNTPFVPADAGTLVINASKTLNALGTVQSAGASGGAGATIEITGSDITVAASQASAGATGITVLAPVLQSWNAGDLVLGGQFVTDPTTGAVSLDVTAGNVTIGQGAQFSANQVLVVAGNTINVQAGAVVASTSGLSGTAPKTLPANEPIMLSGPAALLAVSDTGVPVVNASGSGGSITIEGATANLPAAELSTRGAVSLKGALGVTINGNIDAPGASWSLASNSIAFVPATGVSSTDTFLINPTLLSQLQTAGAIQLTSAGAIDLLTGVDLGATSSTSAPTLGSLTLTATQINNGCAICPAVVPPQSSVFGAQTLTLNGTNSTAVTATGGSGALTLVANTLNLGGSGNLAINGNATTTMQVSGSVVGEGSNQSGTSTVAIAGNVSIAAADITAASQTATAISVPNGVVTITQNGSAPQASSLTASLGGQIGIAASSIQDSGSIIVPGGQISLATTGDLALNTGAVVDVSGITVTEVNQTEAAAGGIVNITAGGNLSLAQGSTINVSGGEYAPVGAAAGTELGAPAGSVSLVGGGNVSIDPNAILSGLSATNVTGGSFSLDAGSLTGGGIAGLVPTLMSGGFTNQVGIEVHNGDLDLAAGQSLTANQIILTADSGAVDINGNLTATAAGLSGFIGLYGGTGVTLGSSGILSAAGIASAGHGGEIELSSTCATCSVTFMSGSTIKTNGGADGGELVIEAPWVLSNGQASDVAINVGSSGLGPIVGGVGQVIVEPVLVDNTATASTINNSLTTDINTASGYLAAAGANISQRLNPGGSSAITVQAGVELDDTRNEPVTLLSPQTPLDLSSYSSPYSGLGQVIDLTVRTAGSLTIAGTISDGYDASNGLYTPGSNSATLRFVAGADLDSANPLATIVGTVGATLNIGRPATTQGKSTAALISTGTGNIDLAASGNINFTAGSSAYTTGVLGESSYQINQNVADTINFPMGGGNVVVRAGQNLTGVLPSDDGAVVYWEQTTGVAESSGGTNVTLGEYGVNLTNFATHPWDVATFGGGDVSVSAGGTAFQFSAAAADSVSVSTDTGTQTHLASGGITVNAGQNVTNGLFLAADGIGTFTAGGSFGTAAVASNGGPVQVGSLFYAESSQISLWAQGDIAVAGVTNPTIEETRATGATNIFWSYGADAGFSAQSASGDVTLEGLSNVAASELFGTSIFSANNNANGTPRLNTYTPSVNLVALQGDVALDGAFNIYPSVSGKLTVFAGTDIIDSAGSVNMSDVLPGTMSTVTDVLAGGGASISGTGFNNTVPDGDVHLGNPTSTWFVAGRDILDLKAAIPEAADIEAGRDIVSLNYIGQNLSPNDTTLIYAGRNFTYPLVFGSNGSPAVPVIGVELGGPGNLDILAGGDINLGFSVGVLTVGNLANANLPTSTGANVTMVAGLGQGPQSYTTFYQNIIAPSATYQQELVSYVESLTGQSNLSEAAADTEFSALASNQQLPFVDNVFFNELNLSGEEENTVRGAGFSRGYAAIDALFPGTRSGTPTTSEDLDLTYSQIYTESGGNISLLAPGGTINVGLAVPPAGVNAKAPSSLGIVAVGPGNVDIYSLGSVNVDSSRIFTLGGGNILIWSDLGSIDAGEGSKTSLSAPPPTYSVNANGDVITNFGAAVAGSGIRTIQTNPDQPFGNVNLIAPAGTVNAGQAGIGAAGSINIAALSVLNVANISSGGTATGVPPLVSGVTASLASAASAASSATSSVTSAIDSAAGATTQQAPLTQSAISWLDVFVTGLGDENCKPEDTECLQRQKHE
jgi:filamentous hemagglutinin